MRALAVLLLLILAAGCATARASNPVEWQPLDVPPVPPRVIVPEVEEPAPAPTEVPAAKPAAKPDAARPSERTAEPPKAETQQDLPKVEEAPRVRTPQTANDEQAERAVRAVMGRAQGTLQRVDYRALSAAARQQYDTAKRFLAQAEDALKIRNYVFARNLADKAETLARQLGK